jgi:23S rRNA (cytidine1920-2'-O)/16S rRNA (cytidine1409-2'-O)-methyltransferase
MRTRKLKSRKRRLDQVLLDLGLAESRHQAQGLIMAGRVRIAGQVFDKAGAATGPDVDIVVEAGPTYVSRGGLKLAHALDHFGLDVRGLRVVDVGASTGGFTDCLLQRGAVHLYAVDVGRGQLHERLRRDDRVTLMERVNAHAPFELSGEVEMAVIDVSFISLTKVMPNVLRHLKRGQHLLGLVKPQFEAGREQVGRGGVVRDPMVHGQVLAESVVWAVRAGLRLRGIMASPIEGDKGNREFFVLLEQV